MFLDMLSLLEAEGREQGARSWTSPTIEPPAAQYLTLGRLVSLRRDEGRYRRGSLVTKYARTRTWEEGGARSTATGELCAAHASVSVRSERIVAPGSDPSAAFARYVPRGAEIAANRRLTYRDLLGHVSLAVIGAPEEDGSRGQARPCRWVEDIHHQAGSGTGQKSSAVRLARHRIYANLYPGGGFLVRRRSRRER